MGHKVDVYICINLKLKIPFFLICIFQEIDPDF